MKISDGEVFQLILEECNISIKDLAELTGIPVQTLYTLKRRTTNKTSPELKEKISKALNIPLNRWNITREQKELIKVFGEKFIDPTDTVTFDPEITKETMEIKEMTVEHIKYFLDFVGESQFSVSDIHEILFSSKPVNSNIAQNIRFYISSGKKIADMPELSLLRKIRRLSKDAKIEFFRALDTITDADKYRNQFNNLGDN